MPELQRQPSFDEMLDALADIQRRTLLVELLERTPQTVAPPVTDDEAEDAVFEQGITLTHVHLPKLADYGFIEWDRENDEVSKGPAFDQIRPLVELLDIHRDELPGSRE